MDLRIRTALVVLASLALADPAAALIIVDDFESGPFALLDDLTTPGATFAEQSGLAQSSVIGGVRLVSANALGLTGATATADLATAPLADDSVLLTAVNSGTYNFFYDGIADGAFNGSAGALNADLSGETDLRIDVTSSGGGGAGMRVYLYDSVGSQFTASMPVTTGSILVSLSLFPSIDLTDIQTIRVFIDNVSVSNGVTVSQIAAVPEPGTALLLGAGLAGIAARRRSRRQGRR